MYGTGSFGEAAFGESPGGAFPIVVGVVGSMGAIEPLDIFSALGDLPIGVVPGGRLVADPNLLVLLVELELGQLNVAPPVLPPPPEETGDPIVDGVDRVFDGLDRVVDGTTPAVPIGHFSAPLSGTVLISRNVPTISYGLSAGPISGAIKFVGQPLGRHQVVVGTDHV